MWEVIGRITVVAFAFLVSLITAVCMMVILGGRELGSQYQSSSGQIDPEFQFLNDFMGVALFIFAIGPALTILPALIAVIIGEVARIRSMIYYMIAGGLAVLAIPFLYVTGDGISYVMPNARYMTIFSASGFVAGFLYWVLAGRRA